MAITRAEAIASFDQLEQLARGAGVSDGAVARRCKSLIFGLRLLPGGTDYYREMLASASRWIDVLYNERRQRVDVETYGGVDRVRGFILRDLRVARANIPIEPDAP
jgi:hypothetical protein